MSKSKKESKADKINYFLKRAQYYNNAGRYKKAAQQINVAYSVWEGYKNPTSKKAEKMLDRIWDAREIVEQNYVARKTNQINTLFFSY